MGNWLGTGTVAPSIREYWSFEKARACVQDLKLRSREEWDEYCKSRKKPKIEMNLTTHSGVGRK